MNYYRLYELATNEQTTRADLAAAEQALRDLAAAHRQGTTDPAEQVRAAAAAYQRIVAARERWHTAADAYYAARRQERN